MNALEFMDSGDGQKELVDDKLWIDLEFFLSFGYALLGSVIRRWEFVDLLLI